MKKETEGMLFAAQEQALRTNSIKAKIDKQPVSLKCRLCGTEEETVIHLASGCHKLVLKQYKRRHDNFSKTKSPQLSVNFLNNCDTKILLQKQIRPDTTRFCLYIYIIINIRTSKTYLVYSHMICHSIKTSIKKLMKFEFYHNINFARIRSVYSI